MNTIIEKIRAEIERLKKQEKENEKSELMSDSWILGRQVMLEHFEHFLNFLQQEQPPVPADLEEAAEEYLQKVKARFLRTLEHPTAKDCFIAGAKWQKEQMMKEAVEGEVVKDINNKLAVTAKNVNLDKFKFGNKVRIIICKKED